MRKSLLTLLLTIVALLGPRPARAFIVDPNDPGPFWTTTASGSRTANGTPATLTWSLARDGTRTTNDDGVTTSSSNLISFLNTNFGGNAAQSNFTLQPWFPIFTQAFARWSELSGVNFVYESHDDSATNPSSNGALGVRGDIRIGGINVDGSSGTLAFTYLPNIGDMVIDTSDLAHFTDAANNYRNFRNTLMHEIGHAFGLQHVESTSNLLMEPFDDPSIDGPQLDEVRAVQYYFGDANEKSFSGQGNNTAAHATSLGTLGFGAGGGKSIGTAASGATQQISSTATDFVSLSNLADVDFYSFSVTTSALVSATLTPRGGSFNQAGEGGTPTPFNANARDNLALTILDKNGTTVLQTADSTLAGGVESVLNLVLPTGGQYFARVSGADDTVQLYELSLSAVALKGADFNIDGQVLASDLAIWKSGFGTSAGATRASGDATADGRVDGNDFLAWQRQFGAAAALPTLASVPEPPAAVEALSLLALVAAAKRRYLRG